jgi:hypothetical protein
LSPEKIAISYEQLAAYRALATSCPQQVRCIKTPLKKCIRFTCQMVGGEDHLLSVTLLMELAPDRGSLAFVPAFVTDVSRQPLHKALVSRVQSSTLLAGPFCEFGQKERTIYG